MELIRLRKDDVVLLDVGNVPTPFVVEDIALTALPPTTNDGFFVGPPAVEVAVTFRCLPPPPTFAPSAHEDAPAARPE